jgi:hypothetical protein
MPSPAYVTRVASISKPPCRFSRTLQRSIALPRKDSETPVIQFPDAILEKLGASLFLDLAQESFLALGGQRVQNESREHAQPRLKSLPAIFQPRGPVKMRGLTNIETMFLKKRGVPGDARVVPNPVFGRSFYAERLASAPDGLYQTADVSLPAKFRHESPNPL